MKKENWSLLEKEYVLIQDGYLVVKDTVVIPLRVFINDNNGEIKIFAKKAIEHIGIDNVLKELNKLSKSSKS